MIFTKLYRKVQFVTLLMIPTYYLHLTVIKPLEERYVYNDAYIWLYYKKLNII